MSAYRLRLACYAGIAVLVVAYRLGELRAATSLGGALIDQVGREATAWEDGREVGHREAVEALRALRLERRGTFGLLPATEVAR